ncbi:hypothetical protein J4P02_21620 [Pseudomonas sp. NFXW11]|uniref:hypothetical protein n=1 Tax=Pseudomonas sp. NFXW11 TaxID=2819531 RepID=UPI003CEBDB77
MIRPLVLLAALLALSGCYSLSSTKIAESMSPDPQSGVAYVVGVVGIWPKAVHTAKEQMLMIRPRGGDGFASARLYNEIYGRTPRDVRETWHGIGSLFVMPLKPGRYEIYNLHFDRGNATSWSREDFSIPLELEAGKAYYLGDFRAGCLSASGAKCVFLHSDHLERDAALVRAKYPQVPSLQRVDLEKMEELTPLIVKEQGPKASMLKAMLSGEL